MTTHTLDTLMALAYKIRDARTYEWDVSEIVDADKKLRAALAELIQAAPVQAEPVAWRVRETNNRYALYFNKYSADRSGEVQTPRTYAEPLYAAPKDTP